MVDVVITRGNTGQGLTITLTPQLLGYGWPVEAGVSVGMSNVTTYSNGVPKTETYVYAAVIPIGLSVNGLAPIDVAFDQIFFSNGFTVLDLAGPGFTLSHASGAQVGTITNLHGDVVATVGGLRTNVGEFAADFSLTIVGRLEPAEYEMMMVAPCFAAGTPILLGDGTSIAIEDIRAGMRVAAFDERDAGGTGDLTSGLVARLIPGITSEWIVLADGTRVTPHHRYLCPPADAAAPHAAATFSPIADILGIGAGATRGTGLVVDAAGSAVIDVPAGANKIAASAWSYPGTWTTSLEPRARERANSAIEPLDAKAGQTYKVIVEPRGASFGPGLLGPIGGAIDAASNDNDGAFQMRVAQVGGV